VPADFDHLYMFVKRGTTDCGRGWGDLLPVVVECKGGIAEGLLSTSDCL